MILQYDRHIATFLHRPNRFLAHVELDGEEVICHVPNTGRLRELLYPGVTVLITYHPEETRKTRYELRMVLKGEQWISIDSQLPNALANEAIAHDVIKELRGYSLIRREVVYGHSRFDLQLEKDPTYRPVAIDHTVNHESSLDLRPCFVEVKGVTLEKDGWTYFPDAPTERGRKHIDELIRAVHNGYRGVLLFVVQLDYAKGFTPNYETDPAFYAKVKEAKDAGVEILAYRSLISESEVVITDSIPVVLPF